MAGSTSHYVNLVPETQHILVFGATGAIGRFIVDALFDAKKYSISVFTSPESVQTKAEAFDKLKSRGAKVIVGNVHEEQSVKAAYEGIDTVISAVGRAVIEDQINLLKWAEDTTNVKRFFPSEYGTDIEYAPESANEKPHQLKLKVRKYIKENVKRLSYIYLVTGPYVDMHLQPPRLDPKVGGFDVRQKQAIFGGTGDEKISFITMHDVGKLLVAALEHPHESHNKALKVNSFTTTSNEIVGEFERQTGGENWKVTRIPLDEMRKNEKDAWDTGLPYATVFTLRRIWTEGGTLYARRDNEDLGCTDVDNLETAVRQAIEAQLQERSHAVNTGT